MTFAALRAYPGMAADAGLVGQHMTGTWGALDDNSNSQGMKVSFSQYLWGAFKSEISESASPQLLLTVWKL